MPSELRPDREEVFNHTVSQMLGVILNFIIVITAFKHHDRRPGNDNSEDNFNVRPQTQQARTDGDKDAPEDDGTNDPPVENTVAITIRNGEPGEDCHHDEQVIDRQHFLQRITRDKQTGNLSTVVDIEETGKCHRNHNPEYGPERSTLQRDWLVITVHKQVNKDGTD
ncbi:hypothetical protein EC09E025_01161 [Escherichia coli O145:H28]|nr:hypothetical protein EC09E025_01161 [Escherichia coli O145:H28]